MDVSCTRCGTEYEFDDALISERGTNVRCTQCGYQFKVFPPKLATVGPDEWIVLTGLGRRIVYRSLRELQNGIVKGDVAREDLLARGSKAPRPLGSIAELDPLFVVKSAPDRQSSTLTGVAPPNKAGTEPPEPQTYSGVAPPANGPAPIQPPPALVPPPPPPPALAPPSPPALAPPPPFAQSLSGRSGTVLGLGGVSIAPTASDPPETRPYTSPRDSEADSLGDPFEQTARLAEAHGIHAKPPPPARAVKTALGVGTDSSLQEQKPEASPALPDRSKPGEASLGESEPARPETAKAEPAKPAAATRTAKLESDARAEPAKPEAAKPEPAQPIPPMVATAGRPPAAAEPGESQSGESAESPAAAAHSETALARVQLQHKLVPANTSEPPTIKLHADPTAQNPSSKISVAPLSEPDANSTRLMVLPNEDAPEVEGNASPRQLKSAKPVRDPSSQSAERAAPETGRRIGERPADENADQGTDKSASKGTNKSTDQGANKGANKGTDRGAERLAVADQATRNRAKSRATQASAIEPTKQQSAAQNKSEKSGIPWGRIAVTIGLLVLSGYVGMRIVGAHLQNQKQRAVRSPVPSARPASGTWVPAVEAAIERGDDEGAQKLLAAVPSEERDASAYSTLTARIVSQSCDKIWWRVQLVGKDAGEAYAQSKQKLSECLEHANRAMAEAKIGNDAAEPALAAWLDVKRMQGEKSVPNEPRVIELLQHPTHNALRYTSAILSWVKNGVPEDAVITALRELRAAPGDLGPRSPALVAALVQRDRFDEAREEIKSIQSRSPAHPLKSEMASYLERAERAPTDAQVDAGVAAVGLATGGAPAASDASKTTEVIEADDPDKDLYAGDFRVRLTRANECLSRNELTRAQKLLRSVLSQRPNDTEAITAMGDVHRRRGDLGQARQTYEKALAINGNYLPAMTGLADIRWKSGDRAGAVTLYRRILERVGDTPGYGQVAAQRIREVEGVAKDQP